MTTGGLNLVDLKNAVDIYGWTWYDRGKYMDFASDENRAPLRSR